MTAHAGPIRLLDLGGLPGLHTQAVYHVLAERMTAGQPDTVVLTWPTEPYLCLGYHQRACDVLDAEAARARGLPVLRRRVGGGLTYLDASQVFYQFIFHHQRVSPVPRRMYASLLGVPVRALLHLGLDARLVRDNEIEVGSRRIAGIGAGRIGEASVVVGNVLLDFDFEAMAGVWPDHAPGFKELAGAALRERVTTLAREGIAADRQRVTAALRDQLPRQLGREVEESSLTDEEVAALEPMARRLADPEFVHRDDERAAPRRICLKISARAVICSEELPDERGALRVAALVRDDVIVEARAESALPARCAELEAALAGRPLADLEPAMADFVASGRG